MRLLSLACVAGVALAAQNASAQLTLAIDIQGIDYQFRDSGGAATFGGAGHTGTLEWTGSDATSADTRMGSGGRFGVLSPVAQGVAISDVSGSLQLASGIVTGGSLSITLDNPEMDTYTASIEPGTGQITGANTLGFQIDGLTLGGAFSDGMWGDVDVAPWFAAQENPGGLPGAFFKFRFQPGATASGNGDIEAYVMVPLPPAAWGSIAALGGIAGVGTVRRRRLG